MIDDFTPFEAALGRKRDRLYASTVRAGMDLGNRIRLSMSCENPHALSYRALRREIDSSTNHQFAIWNGEEAIRQLRRNTWEMRNGRNPYHCRSVCSAKELADLWEYPPGAGSSHLWAVYPWPPPIFQYVIERCTRPGDLVVNVMAGNGASAFVAKGLGRRHVGLEVIDELIRSYVIGDTMETAFLFHGIDGVRAPCDTGLPEDSADLVMAFIEPFGEEERRLKAFYGTAMPWETERIRLCPWAQQTASDYALAVEAIALEAKRILKPGGSLAVLDMDRAGATGSRLRLPGRLRKAIQSTGLIPSVWPGEQSDSLPVRWPNWKPRFHASGRLQATAFMQEKEAILSLWRKGDT